MSEDKSPSPEYLKGFNQGYLFEKETPELSEKLAQALESHDTDNAKGFLAGRQEYQKEKTNTKRPSWLKDDRLSSLRKDLSKEKDKGDIEKD